MALLAQMKIVVPWRTLCAEIEPFYPTAGGRRPPPRSRISLLTASSVRSRRDQCRQLPWLKHPAILPKLIGTFIAQKLAARYDAVPSAADWRRFGRLPCFTNCKLKLESAKKLGVKLPWRSP